MKNAFCFTSKALFALKVLNFLSWIFGRVAKRLDQKDQVNFKICDVASWLTNNCNKHLFPNISRGNQTMTFDQLMDYDMRNIFLEKSYTKCGGKTSSRPFSKK